MNRMECFEELVKLREDELVVTHMGVSATEWMVASDDQERTFYLKSAMGMVSSFSLGLAISMPHRSVWGIDGDGSFLMNLGSLMTLGQNQPQNMKHMILSNGVYESTASSDSSSANALVNAGNIDYLSLAKGANIKNAYYFDDIEMFRRDIGPIVKRPEYAMIVLEIDPWTGGQYEVYPSDPIEQTYTFGRYLEKAEGITLFKYQPLPK